MTRAAGIVEWVVFVYFVGLNAGYLALDVVALLGITRYMRERSVESLPHGYSGLEPPVSIVVPAYNEEPTIEATVEALMQLTYPEFEVVVVNDGSTDGTLGALIRRFRMVAFPEATRVRLGTAPVRAVYASALHPNLRVIDKENGGKSDALNAGINAARYPLFCAVDADSILQRDSLARVARPFMEDARTVACGGTVRVANGCFVRGGFLERAGLPRRPLPLFQIVEYLRAFLFGRFGWSPINALLVISGAFGLFDKEAVVAAGGYRTDTVGEDIDLVVRLHRHLRAARRPYRITFVPDPICWTEVPEDLRSLGRQRIRWQRGLAETLIGNAGLLFRGSVGWLSFPFAAIFECLGPVIELAGYVFFLVGLALGVVSPAAVAAFLMLAIGVGLVLSVSAILLEEVSFHVYPEVHQVPVLLAAAAGEVLGYRQLNSVWRLVGLVRWARGPRRGTLRGGARDWGEMTRSAAWRRPGASATESRATAGITDTGGPSENQTR